MKKILLAAAIGSLTLLSFNSCTKEYIDYYDTVPSITMIYERADTEWSGTENDAFIELSVPELTSYYMDQGIVNISMSADNEASYSILPASFANASGDPIAYSVTYSVGKVVIRAQDPLMDEYFVEVPKRVFIKVSLTETDWVE